MATSIHNSGDGSFINTGNNATSIANITINKGDLAGLKRELEKLGIESEDLKEITDIVQTETPDAAGGKLGPKASSWVEKMGGKLVSGTGKIAASAAGNIAATLIKSYLNIH